MFTCIINGIDVDMKVFRLLETIDKGNHCSKMCDLGNSFSGRKSRFLTILLPFKVRLEKPNTRFNTITNPLYR